MKILNVVGARPNFMKIAPIMEAFRDRAEIESSTGGERIQQLLVHTGQHYDRQLSELFFEQLEIPSPDFNLGVGSGSHARQTAEIMTRFESVCTEQKPSHILVVGDVNSTIACALVATKLGISVVHVEAGLRSFDRTMPEEINRLLTDAISNLLFTTEESANQNLRREGVPDAIVHFVGNVMIDTLLRHRARAEASTILDDLGLAGGSSHATRYGVLTLHRPATVDDRERFNEILEGVEDIARELPIVFPMHPRTRADAEAFGFLDRLAMVGRNPRETGRLSSAILAIEPLGYLDFLRLLSGASVVMTDSGGIQEETTILGVPCVTLRNCTERPVTIQHGTNVLAGTRKEDIIVRTRAQLDRRSSCVPVPPPLWDGKAAQRIVEVLLNNGVAGNEKKKVDDRSLLCDQAPHPAIRAGRVEARLNPSEPARRDRRVADQ